MSSLVLVFRNSTKSNEWTDWHSWAEWHLTQDNLQGERNTADLLLYNAAIQTSPFGFLDVVFSTTHKSKGLEWEMVKVCNDYLETADLTDLSSELKTP